IHHFLPGKRVYKVKRCSCRCAIARIDAPFKNRKDFFWNDGGLAEALCNKNVSFIIQLELVDGIFHTRLLIWIFYVRHCIVKAITNGKRSRPQYGVWLYVPCIEKCARPTTIYVCFCLIELT